LQVEEVVLRELDVIQRHLTAARDHVKSVELHPLLTMMAGHAAERRELQSICDRLNSLSFDLARREVALAVPRN
jgi:hypothetical protein